ncbi:uncharacterized protein [Lepisosteus oculatus]|nr:PREDICTED: uncharacterized protein LOC107077577 isoform X2 [Lepisosteus oculatus]
MPVVRPGRVELAERQNKQAEERLSRHLSAMDLRCSRQLAQLQEQKRRLSAELCSIRCDTTPSLENLLVEMPPDLPRQILSRKRISLPTLQLALSLGAPGDGLARRNLAIPMPTDFQKRMSSFLSELEQLKRKALSEPGEEGCAEAGTPGEGQVEEGGLSEEEPASQREPHPERERQKEVETPEVTWQRVQNCRYLHHREILEQERELSLQEIFSKEGICGEDQV